MNKGLIQKYNIPGPRYTSYPTVPFWDKEGISMEHWKETTVRAFKESNDKEGITLYIHLPFCEKHVIENSRIIVSKTIFFISNRFAYRFLLLVHNAIVFYPSFLQVTIKSEYILYQLVLQWP